MHNKFIQKTIPKNTNTITTIINLNNTSITKTYKKTTKNQIISPINFNSPKQIIITNHKKTIKHTNTTYKTTNTKHTLPLPINIPSHYTLIKPTTNKLTIKLTKITFNTPTIPIINNINIKYKTNNNTIHNTLIHQLYNPIQ